LATSSSSPASSIDWGRLLRSKALLWQLPLAAVLAWSYAGTIAGLAERWWQDSDYVYGFLVIPFSLLLLRLRRDMRPARFGEQTGTWWGAPLIVFAVLMRCASAYTSDPVLEPLSLIPCLAGVTLCLGGWRVLRWAWPSLVFLAFMIPLPSFAATYTTSALQRIATNLSTFALQTIGFAAAADGNVIVMSETQLGVVEACGGLRLMMLFTAVCVAAALVVRDIPEKVLILVSAIPATIAANVIRITITGILQELGNTELANAMFHDLVGFIMLPVAVLLIWGEIALLRYVLVPKGGATPVGAAIGLAKESKLVRGT
jgi:exosortase